MVKPRHDKKLTDAARDQPCIRCGNEGETRACHYAGFRQHSFGKGRGQKASDHCVAYFCEACDQLFSEANYHKWEGGSKSIDRSEQFLYYIVLTIILRESIGK